MPNYRLAARRAAKRHGLNPDLFERQIGVESNFDPAAGSPAGAQGIAQFVPGTAKGMGVNLNDGRVSDDLDGAARLMASYVKKYGSYENALRAYNAGPGAIEASKGYRETNNYVAKILRGSNPRGTVPRSSTPRASSGGQDTETTRTTTTTPGVDNSALRQQMLQQYLLSRGKPDALLGLARGLSGAQDVAPTSETSTSSRRVRKSQNPVSSGTRPSDQLTELFYDPTGTGVKRGQKIGAIGGHPDHVHVATGPKQLAAIKKLASDMGLAITSEDEGYDGDGVHTSGSYHYKKRAIDVAGPPERMAKFTKTVARKYRVKL